MTTTPSTRPVTNAITHPAARPFLLTDAALTAGNGLIYLVAASWLADLFGASTPCSGARSASAVTPGYLL